MTFFFISTLVLSSLGLILLLSLKRYEMRTGRVVFARSRPRLERGVRFVTIFVQYLLPFVARRGLAAMLRGVRATLTAVLARAVLSIESTLAGLLSTMQHAMQPKRGGPASTFLQEVADHKRRLLRGPAEKRAIFEEYQQ
jgi:hypothetical protein